MTTLEKIKADIQNLVPYKMTYIDKAGVLNIINKYAEQEPCDDAISREAVDKYIARLLSGYLYEEERERLEKLSVYLWELPPVQPKSETVTEFADRCRECGAKYGKLLEQKSGKWIDIPDNATNGNSVIKMFCKGIVRISSRKNVSVEFDKNWWNSPYQKGGE